MSQTRVWHWAIIVAAVAVAGCERKLPWPAEPVAAQAPAEVTAAAPAPSAPAMRVELPDFTGLVEAYGGAVVNVAVAGTPMRRAANGAEESPRLGLTVRPLTGEEREALATEGALVVTDAAGRAAVAGIEPGDVVLAVNGKPVRSIAELRKAVERSGKVVALLIQREEGQIFVPIPLEDGGR